MIDVKKPDLKQVYVIIPVFNRLAFTMSCIEALKKQTYSAIQIVVADGGSTDGSPQILRDKYHDVIVLTGEKELWWSGAVAMAIDYVLHQTSREAGYVLLLNNDTLMPDDYVMTLVDVSMHENAAVVGVIVDSANPLRVLDAGDYIDWKRYAFPVRATLDDGISFCSDVDTLPGRGTLVPIKFILAAGNVDYKTFPHYLGDYDFFYRIKKNGYRLGVTGKTHLLAHIDETGLVPSKGVVGVRQLFLEHFSRRSMSNVIDHWRFISRHAPNREKNRLKMKLAFRLLADYFTRTKLSYLVVPLQKARILYGYLKTFILGPLPAASFQKHGLNASMLAGSGILRNSIVSEWYFFKSLKFPKEYRFPLTLILISSLNPICKVRNIVDFLRRRNNVLHNGRGVKECS